MRKIVTDEELREWKERQLAGETCRSISQDYAYNESTISRHIRKMGISRGKGNLPQYLEIKPTILKEYQENKFVTLSDLAKKYNINEKTISSWIKQAGIKIKQTSGKISHCDENFFNIIDNPHKAYILGFITADGSVISLNKDGEPRTCAIEVHEKDKEILDFIKEQINPEVALTPCFYGIKRNYRIAFNSKKLCQSLKKYGIVPNKSKIIEKVPIELIPKQFLPFYFRGLFDGDGCAHKDGGLSFYSGSEAFTQSVQEILVKEANVKRLSIYKGTTYFISQHSAIDRAKLFHYLYDNLNDTYYYPRKYKRIKESLYGNTEVNNQIT